MSPNPSDDTNALLALLVQGKTVSGNDLKLPSSTFTPTSQDRAINVLFSLSLSTALLAAFFAVLGREWLVYYKKRTGGGADRRRWDQLRRFMGAKRWGMVAVLELAVPLLLQAGLVIFAIGLVLALRRMDPALAIFIIGPLAAAGFFFLLTIEFSIWDPFCPFKTPLSQVVAATLVVSRFIYASTTRPVKSFAKEARARLLQLGWSFRVWSSDALHGRWTFGNAARVAEWRAQRMAFGSLEGRTATREGGGRIHGSDSEETIERGNGHHHPQPSAIDGLNRVTTQVLKYFGVEVIRPLQGSVDRLVKYSEGIPLIREAETTPFLYVQALIRVFKVSEEPLPLYHAAANLCSIADPSTLKPLIQDEVVRTRLWDSYLDSVGRLNMQGPLSSSPSQSPTLFQKFIVYGAASYHTFFLVGSLDTFFALTHTGKSLQSSRSLDLSHVGNDAIWHGSIEVRDYLLQFLKVQRSNLGSHPTIITSISLAVYALYGVLEHHSSYFSDYLGRRLRATVKVSASSWNGLALLAFLCNTTVSVPSLRASREDVGQLNRYVDSTRGYFRDIQRAYNT